VYRLVAQGTIEEEILALHERKRDLVAGVLGGTDRAGKLSTEDLVALIRGDAEAGAASAVGGAAAADQPATSPRSARPQSARPTRSPRAAKSARAAKSTS